MDAEARSDGHVGRGWEKVANLPNGVAAQLRERMVVATGDQSTSSIILNGNPPQVLRPVVISLMVDVVALETVWRRPVESLAHQAVNPIVALDFQPRGNHQIAIRLSSRPVDATGYGVANAAKSARLEGQAWDRFPDFGAGHQKGAAADRRSIGLLGL
jgi:hypothetical protein